MIGQSTIHPLYMTIIVRYNHGKAGYNHAIVHYMLLLLYLLHVISCYSAYMLLVFYLLHVISRYSALHVIGVIYNML